MLSLKAPNLKIVELTNGVDEDEAAHNELPHLDLHCLLKQEVIHCLPVLMCLGIPPCISAIYTRGEQIVSVKSWTPLKKRGKNENGRDILPKSAPIHFNFTKHPQV